MPLHNNVIHLKSWVNFLEQLGTLLLSRTKSLFKEKQNNQWKKIQEYQWDVLCNVECKGQFSRIVIIHHPIFSGTLEGSFSRFPTIIDHPLCQIIVKRDLQDVTFWLCCGVFVGACIYYYPRTLNSFQYIGSKPIITQRLMDSSQVSHVDVFHAN